MRYNAAGTERSGCILLNTEGWKIVFLKFATGKVRFFDKQKSDFAKQELGELIDMNCMNLYNIYYITCILRKWVCAKWDIERGTSHAG